MTVSVFNNVKTMQRSISQPRITRKMRSGTLREFGGGWNEIDSPVGLSTRYASVLKNWYRKQDGSQAVRYGTEYKTNIALGNIARTPNGTYLETDQATEAFGDAVANGKNAGFRFRSNIGITNGPVDVWIEVKVVDGASAFEAALYTDNAGSPGTLIATSPTININTTGFKKFALTGVTLDAATLYWVVISDTGTIGNITIDVVPNQGGDTASGKNDVIASIVDNQLASSLDWQMLVNIYRPAVGNILGMNYLGSSLISVTDGGELIASNSAFTNTSIFDEGYAHSLPFTPHGWSSGFDFVSFTEIKGSMIVCNGVDKPLEVQEDLVVRYLQDLATGSNVNVPIGKYCTTVGDYLVIAGIPTEPSVVYIGAKGTVGTFPGDPAPNDSVSLDLGAYAPEDSKQITGVSSFRSYLFVHFQSATLQVLLGNYDADGNHIPKVGDTLHKFGNIAHNASIPVVNDLLFGDVTGVNTIKRNVLSGEVEPDRLSELIAPSYQNQVAGIPADDKENKIFAVHDRLAGHYMIFVPISDVSDEVRAFVFTFNERMRVKAWSEFNGWTWKCAASSALGRVFFAKDTRIYQYGNKAFNEEFAADLIGEFDDDWENNTDYIIGDKIRDATDGSLWICTGNHTSSYDGTFAEDRAGLGNIPLLDEFGDPILDEFNQPILVERGSPAPWEEYVGDDIEFDWETPWIDAGSRTRLKRLGFLAFDTQGTSQFDVDVFVDNIYKDENNEYIPALTLKYTAGESPGYGGGDQPYGGGRRTKDERLWSHPVKYRIAKLRLHGSTKKLLRVVSISQLYAEGRYGR